MFLLFVYYRNNYIKKSPFVNGIAFEKYIMYNNYITNKGSSAMKTEIVNIGSAVEFDRFVASHPSGHFMQSSLWGRVKDDWGWFGVLCRSDSGEIKGAMAVLVRKISKLPYHLPADMETVEKHREDVFDDYEPYRDSEGNVYACGFTRAAWMRLPMAEKFAVIREANRK